jgi:hypothetical protein
MGVFSPEYDTLEDGLEGLFWDRLHQKLGNVHKVGGASWQARQPRMVIGRTQG